MTLFLFLVFFLYIFDFHCDIHGDMKSEGRREPVKRGKMSGKNEFWSGKSQGILFQI